MIEFIIIAIILTFMYILLGNLMRVAGKPNPLMLNINHNEDKDN